MDRSVYLDFNASTPCDQRVVEEMVPLLTEGFANPASRSHKMGQRAISAEAMKLSDQGLEAGLSYIGLVLENAERQIAAHCEPQRFASSL